MFANECLEHLAYEAVAPAIAMASLMVIFAIDFLAARWLARRSALHAHKEPSSPSTVDEKTQLGHDHDFSGIDEGVLAGRDTARARWEVKLLEAGICFHSIMIGLSCTLLRVSGWLTIRLAGVTLGAQGGDGFVSPADIARSIVLIEVSCRFRRSALSYSISFSKGLVWVRASVG